MDLDLCGARAGNYLKSSLFGGLSSVEAAVREMEASGVVSLVQSNGSREVLAPPPPTD